MTIPTPPPARPVQPAGGPFRQMPVGGTAYVAEAGQLPDDSVLLEEARIVRLQPGDVVALNVNYRLNADECDRMLAQLKEMFPDNKVAVVELGELVVVRDVDVVPNSEADGS
jgi:hypothetical protein